MHAYRFLPLGPARTASFKSLTKKLFVPPILHTLIFNRAPEDVLAWGERLASWGPTSILPAHLVGRPGLPVSRIFVRTGWFLAAWIELHGLMPLASPREARFIVGAACSVPFEGGTTFPPLLPHRPLQAGPVKTDAAKIRSALKSAMRRKGGPYLPDDIETLETLDEGLISKGLTLPKLVDNRMNNF